MANTDLEGGPAVLAQARSTLAQYDTAQARLETLLTGDAPALALLEPSRPPAAPRANCWRWARSSPPGGATLPWLSRCATIRQDTAQWSARQQAWGKAVDALSDWQDAANAASSALARPMPAPHAC